MSTDRKFLTIVVTPGHEERPDKFFSVLDMNKKTISTGYYIHAMDALKDTIEEYEDEPMLGKLIENEVFTGDCGDWTIERQVPLVLFYNNKG